MIGTAVACPDKFRGSLTAAAAATAMARGLRSAGVESVLELPLADGGEGTLDVILATRGGARRTARVTGPLGDAVEAEWAMLGDGTAVVEMARASGHALVDPARRDPLEANTRGTGELIAAAIRAGANHVIVGVGGSATTDGGLAAVQALDWSFRGTPVTVACDVTTAFTDAAVVYGPQKGASDAQIALLTRRLEQLAGVYRDRTGVDVTTVESAGAAGGLAGGLAAIGARLEPGFDVVADLVGLQDALAGADLVVTGEGKLDATSFAGKVVGGVLELAADADVVRRGRHRGPGHRRGARGGVGARRRDGSRAHRPRLAGGRGVRTRRAPRGGGRGGARTGLTPAPVGAGRYGSARSAQLEPELLAVRGHGHDRRTFRAVDVDELRFEGLGEARERGPVDVGESGAPQRGHQDRGGLRAELIQRSVAVLAHTEVHLRGRTQADPGDDVDEQADLHAPALDEGHRLEHVASARRTHRRAAG